MIAVETPEVLSQIGRNIRGGQDADQGNQRENHRVDQRDDRALAVRQDREVFHL